MLTPIVLVPMNVDPKDGGRAPGIPARPKIPRQVELQEEELKLDPPKEGKQTEEEDDDWTLIENGDGDQEVTRRPPPSNDDATRT